MEADKLFQMLTKELADYFGIEPGEISRTTSALDVDGWDSIRHTSLLMHLEQRFGFEFPEEKIFDMNNVGDLADAIREQLVCS